MLMTSKEKSILVNALIHYGRWACTEARHMPAAEARTYIAAEIQGFAEKHYSLIVPDKEAAILAQNAMVRYLDSTTESGAE
jgi:hypothetical protein